MTPYYCLVASNLRVEPPTVPISTRPAADLFADHHDAPVGRSDIDFFTSRTSEPASTRGTSVSRSSHLASPPSMSFDMSMAARKGECPKPRLVRYENQLTNETEPFNLQERVLPHRTEDIGPSDEHSSHLTAKLLAAEEGHHPTSTGEDRAQGSDSHSVRSGSHDQHPGPEGGRQPHAHQSSHPISYENTFTPASQQHGFSEQPHASGMPPWMPQGAPYDYAAALRAGWYPPPMAPYPPFYQPPMHPPYRGSYAEGAPQANNAQQAGIHHGPDYPGGIRGGYGTSTHHHHIPTSRGQSTTLPDVTAASTSLDVPVPNAPRFGSCALPESPRK